MRPRIKAIKVKSTMDYMKPIEVFCKMLNLKNVWIRRIKN